MSNSHQPPAVAALSEDADLHTRELALAARQYDAATTAAPADADALYHHGLVLQQLAAVLAPGCQEQAALLRQACERYEAALRTKPSSHAALYNWGVALSDLARAVKPSSPGEALACLHMASQKYAAALAVNPVNPQALNNWGLVLQELSGDATDWGARDALVRAAMDKFRGALRRRPDFDRAVYNLGTVFYSFACALQSAADGATAAKDGRTRQARDAVARGLFSSSAQYIMLAHALQPAKDIYRKSLGVVRQMLPLPFLRGGYLLAPRRAPEPGGSALRGLAVLEEEYAREWFVLDQASLRAASGMESSLSGASAGLLPTQRGVAGSAHHLQEEEGEPLTLPLADVLVVRRCANSSLPAGEAFWVSTHDIPTGIYLIAEDADAADAWVDALLLAAHLVRTRSQEALADALAPQASRRPSMKPLPA